MKFKKRPVHQSREYGILHPLFHSWSKNRLPECARMEAEALWGSHCAGTRYPAHTIIIVSRGLAVWGLIVKNFLKNIKFIYRINCLGNCPDGEKALTDPFACNFGANSDCPKGYVCVNFQCCLENLQQGFRKLLMPLF